jgi:hypothetical protein
MVDRTRSVAAFALLVPALALASCGDDGADGAGGGGGAPSTVGCEGSSLLALPDDTSEPGPWLVGARTVDVGGLRVEVFYPAAPLGPNDAAPQAKRYDLRDYLPPSEAAKVSDELAPYQSCDCADGLPLDEAHGPYPVIVFVHGTASFRTQSLEQVTHWASRGFVVLAADHPNLYMRDFLGSLCGEDPPPRDLAGDIAKLVAAIEGPSGDLAFLAGRIDATRVGMAGHSAGGAAVSMQGDAARVLVPMAAGGASAGAKLERTLVLGAEEDKVVPYSQTIDGYEATPPPRRLVSLTPTGHLAFASLCEIRNDAGDDIVTVALDVGICGANLAGALFDCGPGYMAAERSALIVNDASTAAFEEILHCAPGRAAWLDGIADRYPEVGEYRSE